MSTSETIKGVLQTFMWLVKEELDSMDHKLFRIVFGIMSFIAGGLIWYFIFNSSMF